ncbi:hypothetical protein WDW86_19540 [Bdellovibrionota bacterium FG-2]
MADLNPEGSDIDYGDYNPTLVRAGNDVFFNAYDDSRLAKLYKFDGVSTTQVSNLNNGRSDYVWDLVALGSTVLFMTGNATGDSSLYGY